MKKLLLPPRMFSLCEKLELHILDKNSVSKVEDGSSWKRDTGIITLLGAKDGCVCSIRKVVLNSPLKTFAFLDR